MFLSSAIRRQPEFRQGVRDMGSVAVGIGAWGLMTGVAMLKSGMSVFESVAMTLLVYAGSSQLAAIPLLIAGAPAWVILATGFCVNLRFVHRARLRQPPWPEMEPLSRYACARIDRRWIIPPSPCTVSSITAHTGWLSKSAVRPGRSLGWA